ncbi:MAG TPA: hypothetical protein VGF19_09030 [Candidatus Acidoferrum sp.]
MMFVSALMSYAKMPIVGRASRLFISNVTLKLIPISAHALIGIEKDTKLLEGNEDERGDRPVFDRLKPSTPAT